MLRVAGNNISIVLTMSPLIFYLVVLLAMTKGNVSGYKYLQNIYHNCSSKLQLIDVVKCVKLQGVKALNRATYFKNINLIDGVSLTATARQNVLLNLDPLNETVDNQKLDELLLSGASDFLDNRAIQINLPKLLEVGRKKNKNKGLWSALLGALAIKGSFLAMAYKGIAIMSGISILVGKMALLLSAILFLKKLVKGSSEKTTFEIVKVPKYTETHTHSSSYEDDGHYRRIYKPETWRKKVGHRNF